MDARTPESLLGRFDELVNEEDRRVERLRDQLVKVRRGACSIALGPDEETAALLIEPRWTGVNPGAAGGPLTAVVHALD